MDFESSSLNDLLDAGPRSCLSHLKRSPKSRHKSDLISNFNLKNLNENPNVYIKIESVLEFKRNPMDSIYGPHTTTHSFDGFIRWSSRRYPIEASTSIEPVRQPNRYYGLINQDDVCEVQKRWPLGARIKGPSSLLEPTIHLAWVTRRSPDLPLSPFSVWKRFKPFQIVSKRFKLRFPSKSERDFCFR